MRGNAGRQVSPAMLHRALFPACTSHLGCCSPVPRPHLLDLRPQLHCRAHEPCSSSGKGSVLLLLTLACHCLHFSPAPAASPRRLWACRTRATSPSRWMGGHFCSMAGLCSSIPVAGGMCSSNITQQVGRQQRGQPFAIQAGGLLRGIQQSVDAADITQQVGEANERTTVPCRYQAKM